MKISQAAAEALVKSGQVNPDTKKPFTMEDFGFSVAPKTTDLSALQSQMAEKDNAIAGLRGMLKAFLNKYNQEKQASLSKRINDLVSRGLGKDYAEANLVPKVSLEMSVLPDGTFSEHPLEITLSALEATIPSKQASAPGSFPQGGSILDNDNLGGTADMTQEQMEAALKAFDADGLL